jgi:hypothetical protein
MIQRSIFLGIVFLVTVAAGPAWGQDCNHNGVPDPQDIAGGTSTDCDTNGVPDECQCDCDGNGLAEACETGNGLVRQMFSGSADSWGGFLERVGAAKVPDSAFNWGASVPDGLPAEHYGVRWTGTITTANLAGSYQFAQYMGAAEFNDGFRLWVNNQLIANYWPSAHGSTITSSPITLQANRRYAFKIEMWEGASLAQGTALQWKLPGGTTYATIPATAFGAMNDVNGNGVPDPCETADCNQNGVADYLDVQSGTSPDCNGNCVPDECDLTSQATIGYWRIEEAADPVLDWGPNHLNGTSSGGALRSTDVPVGTVPQTGLANGQSFDTHWQSVSLGGRFTVSNPANGKLSLGDQSFTIEAWVKLNHISNTSSVNECQYLCQKKLTGTDDYLLDYAVLVQRGNLTLATNYGKTSGLTGRELVLAFGSGSVFWGITSNLEIADTGWHFVSLAHDAARNTVRFTVDDQSETVSFGDNHPAHYTNVGPLLVGAHQTAAMAYNCFLRGRLDELRLSSGFLPIAELLDQRNVFDCNANGIPDDCDIYAETSTDCNANGVPDECEQVSNDCNSNGLSDICDIAAGTSSDCNHNNIPDECDIAAGTSTDCDLNGIPDECEPDCNSNQIGDACDISAGTSPDCNHNGIPDECEVPPLGNGADCNRNGVPDECDLAGGISEDCNADNIPDECQLYGSEYVYLYEDGTSEYGLRASGTHLAWLNRFIVTGEAMIIDGIDLTYVNIIAGAPAMVYLWSDPDGDGNPTDAQVLASAPTTTVNNPGGVFRVDLPAAFVGRQGTSFFVGSIIEYPNENCWPCPLDATAPTTLGVSWIIASYGPIDPNDLSNGAIEFSLLEDAIPPYLTNLVVRAVARLPINDCNLNGVPDSCDLADGTSQDVNHNGEPDECEDCNANGIPDSVDIANGTSQDCQPDGYPDECQLAGHDCNADQIPDECQLTNHDCNGNGVLDSCDLEEGNSTDLNNNGVPDECEDCNHNAIPDDMDIANGTSQDCQPDGLPDECQKGTPAYQPYLLDDGTLEASFGLGVQGDIAWLNHFTVQSGMEVIAYVELVYSNTFLDGVPVTIHIWSDPNQDGNPDDAQVLATASATAINSGQVVFNPVYVGDLSIGPVGTSFFVGALLHDTIGSIRPVTRDTDDIHGESWYAAQASVGSLDPNNLGAAQYFGRMQAPFQFPGNTMIRARAFNGIYPNDCNSNGVPDGCDITAGTSQDINLNGIPDECESNICTTRAGDLDGNNIVNGKDIQGFVSCFLLGPGVVPGCACADMNAVPDGVLNGADLTALVNLLLGP